MAHVFETLMSFIRFLPDLQLQSVLRRLVNNSQQHNQHEERHTGFT